MNAEDFYMECNHFPSSERLTEEMKQLKRMLSDTKAASIPVIYRPQLDDADAPPEDVRRKIGIVALSPSERGMTGNYKCALTHKKCTCWEAGFWYGDLAGCGYKSSSFGMYFDDTCRFYGLRRSNAVQGEILRYEHYKDYTGPITYVDADGRIYHWEAIK